MGEESRAQPVSPKLVSTTSTLQVSRLGQVVKEWPSCCFLFFLSFEPTAFNRCYHCHGILPNRVLLGATPHTALDSEGCSDPDGRTWSSCPPLPPHLAKPPTRHCLETACSPPAQGGREEVGCPLSTCLCVCEALMLLCSATRIIPALKIVV